jgi:hypothetical protein
MRLLIERRCDFEALGCIGAFVLEADDGTPLVEGYTAENPWLNNRQNVSCIPEGVYRAILHDSPKFGRCLWVQDVPERTEILVHVANSQTDVLGCIGPGDDYGWWPEREELAVWNSQDTLDRILQAIQDRGLEEIDVDIRWHHPAYP